jgi:hypothetical protein
MRLKQIPQCAQCRVKNKICVREDGHGPEFCPTLNLAGVIKGSLSEYKKPEIKKFALCASIQEGECYANRGQQHPYVLYPEKTGYRKQLNSPINWGLKDWGLPFVEDSGMKPGFCQIYYRTRGLRWLLLFVWSEEPPKSLLE